MCSFLLLLLLLQERPDAILPTMGGQTGLNLAKNLAESGEQKQQQQQPCCHSTPQHNTAQHSIHYNLGVMELALSCLAARVVFQCGERA